MVVFDPQTGGKILAERIKARAKPQEPGLTISDVKRKNFPRHRNLYVVGAGAYDMTGSRSSSASTQAAKSFSDMKQ